MFPNGSSPGKHPPSNGLSRLRWMLLSLLLIYLLTACSGASPTSPTSLPGTPVDVAGQVNLHATQTALADSAIVPPTATAELPPSPPALAISPTTEPTATESPTPTAEYIGPFHQVSPTEALIAGRAVSITFDPQGQMWLLSEHGFSLFANGEWTGYLADFKGTLAGMDAGGHFWFVSPDGSQISAWDGEQWTDYGPEAGWESLALEFKSPEPDGMLRGPDGSLWLATQQDIRHFDGQRWTVYNLAAMQMGPPQDPGAFLEFHLASLPGQDEIWVGRCDWIGPGPWGGSLVKYSSGTWQAVSASLSAGCISALEVDPITNQLWIGNNAELWLHKPETGSFQEILLPDYPDESLRFGYFTQITTSPESALWIELGLCGGASCYIGEVIYQRLADTWQLVGETSTGLRRRLMFSGEGQTWMVEGEKVYAVSEGEIHLVGELNILASTADESGQLWMVAAGSGPPSLWTLAEE